MELFLDKTLNKFNKEINNFKPKEIILSRKYEPRIENIFLNWMNKYCDVYHQLVHEFNPMKLNIKHKKVKSQKKSNKNTIEILLHQIFNNENENNIINNDKTEPKTDLELLIDLKKALKNKNSSKALSEWFNKYNQLIYYPKEKHISFIQYLENIKNKIKNKSHITLISRLIVALEQYNMFMSFNIQIDIQRGFKYEYSYNDSELEFKIFSNENIPIDNIYWRFLYARMKTIPRLYKKTHKIKFEILLTDQLKELPRKSQIFGPEEVNSGSTNYETITIWRKEEHFKIILHESIHYYNLDGSYDLFDQNNNINQECHYQIADKTETRIYEAYTESLAIFFNSFSNAYQIYYLNLMKQKQNEQKNIILDYNLINKIRLNLWKQEKKFFLLQIAKVFIHINPESNNFKDFLIDPKKCNESRNNIKHKLEETTSLLSYHIIKGANIIFDQEFLEWIGNPFDTHPKSLYKFFEYVSQKTHNITFINLVNQSIKYLKEIGINKFNKSLRMSSYETEMNI
jgi:hypothetical protein